MVPNYFLQNRIGSAVVALLSALLIVLVAQTRTDSGLVWLFGFFGGAITFMFVLDLADKYNPSRAIKAQLAARVRSECPPLFQRIHERKRARGTVLPQPVCNYSVKPAVNLMGLVEATDIQEAIKAGIFTRAEESLLWFAATHMSSFGEVAGKMDVIAHRYCQTVDYFAIRPMAAEA